MTDETDRRTERLKAALRENLRRRKAQGRGRAQADRPTDPSATVSEPQDTEPPGST